MTTSSSRQIRAGIVGGTGYTGVELLRLLARHPRVTLQLITSRKEDGMPVADMFPSLRGAVDLCFQPPDKADLTSCDVVFFATPHGVAMKQAEVLLSRGVKVIDLAADFRLQNTAQFERWYKMPHDCPQILQQAVYGLPELNRDNIRSAQIIGNPGCYPTTVILGLLPLLQADKPLVELDDMVADAKSGVSGAGRKAEVGTLFCEASDSLRAYSVSGHRHHPEIVEQLERIAGQPVGLTFVPHLVPMIRGMFTTLHLRICEDAWQTDFQALYEKHYAAEPFIDVMPAGSLPDTRCVRASNYIRIALHRPPGSKKLLVLVVQDNLVKGAAGQAVQNMNLMFGLPEEMGLQQVAVLP